MARTRSLALALLVLLSLVASPERSNATEELLLSGPMLGYAEMTGTTIWLQTKSPCRAQVRYWKQGDSARAWLSERVATTRAGDCIALFSLDGLEAGTRYDYEVYLNGSRVARPYPTTFQTQPIWKHRGDPPSFRAAVGSCAFVNDAPFDRPGTPYGDKMEVFEAMAKERADFMVWLGDNVYFREPDWLTEASMRSRYAHTRALPQMQAFLASTHNYATWDDHDYGPNDSNGTYRLKDVARRIFVDYWPGVSYGSPEASGVFSRFEWGDVEFFMLDDRYHRMPDTLQNTAGKSMLGQEQLTWLLNGLKSSTATFKIVVCGSQVLNKLNQWEALPKFPADYDRMMDFIRDEKVTGVLFLTGDRHWTELLKVQHPGIDYPLYEFTSSPLTAGASRVSDIEKNNPARVPGTFVTDTRNYGMIEASGPFRDRKLTLRAVDWTGKELWRREIGQAELGVIPRPARPSS